MKVTHTIYIGIALLGMAGPAAAETIPRDYDFQQLKRGGQLFQQNCAVCHGKNAEGTKDWKKTDADGKYPPPPLNGSAHAWHHPTKILVDVIKNGTIRIGGNMPPWKDKLNDDQIKDIIIWFQSKWSDEIYSAWYEIDQRK